MRNSGAADLQDVIKQEIEYIRKHRYHKHPTKPDSEDVRRSLVGLALSGGGIRSATTNLGVLQALSRMNILPLVDYMSSVSGGGYIAACLTSLLSWNGRVANPKGEPATPFMFEHGDRPAFGAEWEKFPFRAEARQGWQWRAGPDIVAHLRTHGNFLIARWGLFKRETMRSIGMLLTGIVYHVLLFLVALFAASASVVGLTHLAAPRVSQVLVDSPAWWDAARRDSLRRDSVVMRPALVTVDSSVERATTPKCPARSPTCAGTATLKPPTLWQRVSWNAEVVRRMFASGWADWHFPPTGYSKRSTIRRFTGIPPVFLPLFWAVLGGVFLGIGTWAWMRWALRKYVRGEAPRTAPPNRGESEEDSFERRALLRLAYLVTGILVVVVVFARYAGKWAASLGFWDSGNLNEREELVWLFTPLAFALATRATGLVITLLGESYSSRWTRRMRSLWGASQAIATYSIWVTALFAVLPFAMYALSDSKEGLGVSALVSFVFTRLLTSKAVTGERKGLPFRLPVGLRNALLGVAVTLLLLFGVLYFGAVIVGLVYQYRNEGLAALVVLAIALAAFGAIGWTVNQDKISPHSFYKDRLAETYLLSELPDNDGRIRLYRDALEMPLSCLHGDVQDPTKENPKDPWRNPAPYHLISAAINLAGSRDLTRKDRKSGYWLFSKLYCGSVQTGFRETAKYRKGETTLARAIAISGAAASSGMGQFTFFAQAFATVLFNVRLGNWIENPDYPDSVRRQERGVNWIRYLWRELTMDTTETSRLVNLSDGGHTGDNVGIYPLLQRRCKVIIACDAEADRSLSFGSFTEALRHAYVDMGIDIDIDLTLIRPDPVTGLSRSHCAIGRIRYPDRPRQESFLVYLKNSLTGDEPEPVLNYKTKAPAFPHESTIDQFFDDMQFESYRALGVHIAEHTLGRWIRSPLFERVRDHHQPA